MLYIGFSRHAALGFSEQIFENKVIISFNQFWIMFSSNDVVNELLCMYSVADIEGGRAPLDLFNNPLNSIWPNLNSAKYKKIIFIFL